MSDDEKELISSLAQDDGAKAAGYWKILLVSRYLMGRTVANALKQRALVFGQHSKGKGGAVLVARDVVDTRCFLLMDGNYSYDPNDIDRFTTHAEGYDHIMGFRRKASPQVSRLHRCGTGRSPKSSSS